MIALWLSGWQGQFIYDLLTNFNGRRSVMQQHDPSAPRLSTLEFYVNLPCYKPYSDRCLQRGGDGNSGNAALYVHSRGVARA